MGWKEKLPPPAQAGNREPQTHSLEGRGALAWVLTAALAQWSSWGLRLSVSPALGPLSSSCQLWFPGWGLSRI